MSKYTALFTEFFPTIKGAVLKIMSTVHTALGRSSGEHVCWHTEGASFSPSPGGQPLGVLCLEDTEEEVFGGL